MGKPACRLGDLAFCKSDEHGCPACPHTVLGPAISGSPNVNANGRAALRVGDMGIHAACCGQNMWVAVKGSKTVFVNGRPWVGFGDQTQHCAPTVKKEEEKDTEEKEGGGDVAAGGEGGEGGGGGESGADKQEAEESKPPEPAGGQGSMINGSPNVFLEGSIGEELLNAGLDEIEELIFKAIGEVAPAIEAAKEWADISPYKLEIELPSSPAQPPARRRR